MASNPYQDGQLRRARHALGLTQAGIADRLAELAWYRDRQRVGVNADMVAKWERGFKSPKREYQDLLCLLFEATPTELGLVSMVASNDVAQPVVPAVSSVPWAEVLFKLGAAGALLRDQLVDEWETDLMERRELLKSMGLATIASTIGAGPLPMQRRSGKLARDLRPEPETLDSLDELAASYQRLYHCTAPRVLMAPIRAHLRTVEEILRQRCRAKEARRLLLNHAQVALLAGRLTFFDLRDPLAARGYLAMAHDSAVAASADALIAGALGHLSFVPAASGQFSAATEYLKRAIVHADRGAPPVVRSWLGAVASETRANAGDHHAAIVAVADAKRAGERQSATAPPRWFDFYDAARLRGFEGYALLMGGKPAGALRALEMAVEALTPDATKQRTIFLTDIATAHVQLGNVDEACDFGIRAIAQLRVAGYATGDDRLRRLRASLRPHATSRAVRNLEHAIVDL